jgi:hypothetical protein
MLSHNYYENKGEQEFNIVTESVKRDFVSSGFKFILTAMQSNLHEIYELSLNIH